MELKVGMTFTGNEQCFTGRVEVLEIDEPNNRLRVGLTKKNDTFTSNWNEDWNLQHTIWGFERGDYFVKDFTDYPQDLQRSTEQQCNIADVSLSVCHCYNTECMHQRGKFCMAAQFNCEDRQTGS